MRAHMIEIRNDPDDVGKYIKISKFQIQIYFHIYKQNYGGIVERPMRPDKN